MQLELGSIRALACADRRPRRSERSVRKSLTGGRLERFFAFRRRALETRREGACAPQAATAWRLGSNQFPARHDFRVKSGAFRARGRNRRSASTPDHGFGVIGAEAAFGQAQVKDFHAYRHGQSPFAQGAIAGDATGCRHAETRSRRWAARAVLVTSTSTMAAWTLAHRSRNRARFSNASG